MRSLVTGGAGFIGSTLTDALLAAGDQVVVVDDFSTGREENLERALEAGAECVRADISEPGATARIGEIAPDRIFHLAAQADVRKANESPTFDARVNLIGTINVLEAARLADRVPVVFASTGGAAYGEGEGRELPFDETAAPAPESAYGVSKLGGESYVALYRRLHGLPGVALRFGNVYGPRQDPHGEAGVVAIFCGLLLAGARAKVFGDGLQTRDYVFVDDAVDSLLAAAGALADRGPELDGPLNVGTGMETSVLDLLEILGPMCDADGSPEMAPARPGEVQRVAIDPARAAAEIGWTPATPLEDGLRRTVSSFAVSA